MSAVTKMEIVGHLATRHGFSRYLELCTPTTGRLYDRLDRNFLTTAHRPIYNCPEAFDDGLDVDFRAEGFDIDTCLAEIRIRGQRYDIILVDRFMTTRARCATSRRRSGWSNPAASWSCTTAFRQVARWGRRNIPTVNGAG